MYQQQQKNIGRRLRELSPNIFTIIGCTQHNFIRKHLGSKLQEVQFSHKGFPMAALWRVQGIKI